MIRWNFRINTFSYKFLIDILSRMNAGSFWRTPVKPAFRDVRDAGTWGVLYTDAASSEDTVAASKNAIELIN